MLEIDGSYGSGGGQIIRTSVSLSALTKKPVKIYNIRTKRKNPGLKQQHLQGIKSVSEICNGKIKNAVLGAKEIEFYPGEMKYRNLKINIPTAGSIALVLQALMVSLIKIKKEIKINIEGGATYGKWAPPVPYLQNILIPLLEKTGYNSRIRILKHGFYPKGGARVEFTVCPYTRLTNFNLLEKGEIKGIYGVSHASSHLKKANVAERQKEAAIKVLNKEFKIIPDIKSEYCNSASPGSGIQLWIKTENSIIGGNSLGEMGKKSEVVGIEAAKNLIENYKNGAVDKYAADQLLPYLAYAGGKIKVAKITEHCKTNIWTIEKFLPVRFEIDEKRRIISVKK